MAGIVTPGNQRVGVAYDVSWDSAGTPVDLGGVDDVKIDIKLVWEALKCGSTGELKLDDVFRGLSDDSKVSVIVREVQLALIRKLVPWSSGSGIVDLVPVIGARMQSLAKQLTLHPRDKGTDTTEDIQIFKTVPVQSFALPRNGKDPDKWEVVFAIYPDLTKLATTPLIDCYMNIKGT